MNIHVFTESIHLHTPIYPVRQWQNTPVSKAEGHIKSHVALNFSGLDGSESISIRSTKFSFEPGTRSNNGVKMGQRNAA
jgi:hypothetical protein